MNWTIYKYELIITDEQIIDMPIDATILSVHKQNNKLCLWVKVNPDVKYTEERCIHIYGTGNPIFIKKEIFIGTVVFEEHGAVWHVFEGKVD